MSLRLVVLVEGPNQVRKYNFIITNTTATCNDYTRAPLMNS